MSIPFELIIHIGVQVAFYGALFVFIVQGLIMSFHWLSYGTSKSASYSALLTYFLGGAIIFTLLGLHLMAL